MFSPGEILKRSPSEITAAIIALVDLAIILDWIEVTKDGVAAINIALTLVLGLFYVKATTVNRQAMADIQAAQDEAYDFGAAVADAPKGAAPTPLPGGAKRRRR